MTDIPKGVALNLQSTAEALVDDAATYAESPTETNASDLITSMRIMAHRLETAFAELGVDMMPSNSELEDSEMKSVPEAARDRIQDEIDHYAAEIEASGDVARAVAVEVFRRQSLERLVLSLSERIQQLENKTDQPH